MNKTISALVFALIVLPISVLAWDGYDYETGNYIEIEGGNLVRAGEEIEYYDYESNEYRTFEMD